MIKFARSELYLTQKPRGLKSRQVKNNSRRDLSVKFKEFLIN